MGPDALDKMIIHSLHARGRQSLPELATDTDANAKEILRRLHVLTGQRRVLTGFNDGACMYWLSGSPERDKVQDELQRLQEKRERISTVPALYAEEPPCVAVNREVVAEVDAPAAAPQAVEPAKPERRMPRRYSPIVVRKEVCITELSVQPRPGGGCLISDGSVIEVSAAGDPYQVNIPYEDLRTLIDALERVYTEYAP